MAKKKKPTGFGKFSALAKLLVQVPRADVEAQIAEKPKRRRRKK